MLKNLFLSLCILTPSFGCVTLPNTTGCTPRGMLNAGAMCSENITDRKTLLTRNEYLDFLEPQDEEKECITVSDGIPVCAENPNPNRPKIVLPKRAGAVCFSTADHLKNKNALEEACRLLGKRCTKEIIEAINGY